MVESDAQTPEYDGIKLKRPEDGAYLPSQPASWWRPTPIGRYSPLSSS
jgi:hypothetical protein